jgi:hypothetical protein
LQQKSDHKDAAAGSIKATLLAIYAARLGKLPKNAQFCSLNGTWFTVLGMGVGYGLYGLGLGLL